MHGRSEIYAGIDGKLQGKQREEPRPGGFGRADERRGDARGNTARGYDFAGSVEVLSAALGLFLRLLGRNGHQALDAFVIAIALLFIRLRGRTGPHHTVVVGAAGDFLICLILRGVVGIPAELHADSAVLVSAAAAEVRSQFRAGFNYAKAGAVLSDLRPVGQEQGELDLFSALDEEAAAPVEGARTKLMSAMDALNHRFGRDSIRLGSTAAASSTAEIRVWATKQERRSPRFTTRWDEMPVVRA